MRALRCLLRYNVTQGARDIKALVSRSKAHLEVSASLGVGLDGNRDDLTADQF